MKIKLTKEQEKHYKSLMWLFDSQFSLHAVGRSTLIAKLLIDLALKYPNREIYVSDIHTIPLFGNHPMIDRNFINQILIPMLQEFKEFEFNNQRQTIKYKKVK